MKKRLMWMILFWLGLVAVTWSPAGAQKGRGLGPRLQKLADMHEWEGETAAQTLARAWQLKVRPGGLVPVIIEPHFGKDPKNINPATLERLGGRIDAVSRSYIRVLVPFRFLRRIATHPDVRLARAPTPAKALEGFGSNVAESVALTGAADLQDAGITGEGVNVAVVDLGFIGLSEAIDRGELPEDTVAVDLQGSNDNPIESYTEHGVGVAEHVMDMAPDATLYCIMVGDEVDLENAAEFIRDEGIQVANHSVGWVNASYYDGTGPINNIVNESRFTDGVFWAVAAGNDAERHWRGDWSDPDGDGWLEFSGTDERLDLISASSVAYIFLNWDQYSKSVTDLDLYVTDKRGRVVASSTGWQTGLQDPAEAVGFTYNRRKAPYRIWVNHYAGLTGDLDITIFSFYNDLEYAVAESSLMDPANAPGAFSVAAIDQADWNGSMQPEPYSSQGPTTDGREKPEIIAPDGTTSWTYGFEASFGTSFSSPTTAGGAALLFSQGSNRTAADVEELLRSLAEDLGEAGWDPIYGYGKLHLVAESSNTTPVAYDQSVSTLQNTPVDITLTASDVDGDSLTYSIVGGPTNGTLTGTAPAVTYTPYMDYKGLDSFTFKANDGGADSNVATVTVTVNESTVESLTITKATYSSRREKLKVEATSSLGGDTQLKATFFVDDEWSSPKDMNYNAKKDKWSVTIGGITTKPENVKVCSTNTCVETTDIGGR